MPKDLRELYKDSAKYWIDICRDSTAHIVLMAEDSKGREESESGEMDA